MGKRSDDLEHQVVQSLFDRLEEGTDDRGRPRKLADVLKLPRVSPVDRRLLEAHGAIMDGPPAEVAYQHTVLAQTSMPYRPTETRIWDRQQGAVSLRIEAGAARHPDTGKWVELPLPHGEKPRLVLMHLNAEALRTGSPVVDVRDSMTAFAKALGMDPNGRNLRTLKDQLARLAASRILFGVGSQTIKSDVIDAFDLWWPEDAKQRVMWPSTVRLDPRYFANLQAHAIPLDHRAVAALSHSALDLDIYAWLAQRLHRVPQGKPQLVSWLSLKEQFGPDYDRLRKFREKFNQAIKTVLTVYPSAKVEPNQDGVLLWHSAPPVAKRQYQVPRIDPLTIDGTATRLNDANP